jgi:hypothetical protein
MTEFVVTWMIGIDADTPREAAEKARTIQLKPDSQAVVFEVARVREQNAHTTIVGPRETVDLLDGDG